MKKIVNTIHENYFFIFTISVILIFLGIYLSEVSSNVPYSDYWYYIDRLVDKSFKNGVNFTDLYYGNGVHHTPIQLLLFLMNVKIFSLNTHISLFLGCMMIIPIALILYKAIKNTFINKNNKKIIFYLIVALTLLFTNTLNQWEIMSNEFYFSFQLRIFAFVLSFSFVSNILINKEKYSKYVPELASIFPVIIVFLSGAYFAAYIGSIILVMIADYVMEKDKKKYLKMYLILAFGLLVGAYIYMSTTHDTATSIQISISWILDMFRAFFIMLGASLTGLYTSMTTIIIVGVIMFIIQFVCIYAFFAKKMYKKTYFPLIFILYAFCICGEIYIGRSSGYGLSYLASSRYTCETLWFSVADIWIILYEFKFNKKSYFNITSGILAVFVIGMTVILWLNSNIHEWKMAPYRKEFYSNLNESIINIEKLSDDQLSSFVVEPSIIRRDVEIMKKYKLGIFRHEYYAKQNIENDEKQTNSIINKN